MTKRWLFTALATLTITWLMALPAYSAILFVNSLADVIADDGLCTLREAVIAANTNTSSGGGGRREGECAAGSPAPIVDLITFLDPPGTTDVFALSIFGPVGAAENDATRGDLDLTEDVVLFGNHPATTTLIDANHIGRAFQIFPGVTATIIGLQIHNGKAEFGGGIYNGGGALVLDRAGLFFNEAEHGGAVYNFEGTLTIRDSSITLNVARCSEELCTAEGGGIATIASSPIPVTIESTQIAANRAICTAENCVAFGGGIESGGGPVTITDSVMSSNETECHWVFCNSEGGAIFNWTTVNIARSLLNGNRARCFPKQESAGCYSEGGGIRNSGLVDISASVLEGNTASCVGTLCTGGSGGGISNDWGTVTVRDSSRLQENRAHRFGGGIASTGGSLVKVHSGSILKGNQAALIGGGIYNSSPSQVQIYNSTLDQNSIAQFGAGGGLYNGGDAAIYWSTFSGNAALGEGGAIFNDSDLHVVNSTFSANSATTAGGALANSGGADVTHSTFHNNMCCLPVEPKVPGSGAIFNDEFHTLEIKNSIVANSSPGADCRNFGTFVSSGANLDSDGSCPGFTYQGELPLLGPLINNGGPTNTHALLIGSPGIDIAPDCPVPTDQRGVSRPQGPACDLGAYEGGTTFAQDLWDLIAALQPWLQGRFEAPLREMTTLATDGNPHNDRAICGKLTAFLNQVRATERRAHLTPEQAAALRHAAERLRGGLQCDGRAP